MSLKLLRALVSKNDHFTSMLLKQNYCHLFVVRLYHGNYYFHHRMKFNLQDYNAMKQSFLLRQFSASNNQTEIYFEQICNETLESLSEYFEQIIDNCPQLNNPDITYSDGVLTVQLGEPHGTYVINRQTPNKQIWLSSPTSGPKRYDFNGTKWIYKHDGVSLHELLTAELSQKILAEVDFSECLFSGVK